MKSAAIFLLSFILFFAGCSFYEKISNRNIMEVVNAGYSDWSKPSAQANSAPERGTDLAVIVKNWPQDATPEFIIFNNQRSDNASIKNTSDVGTVINSTITRSSQEISLSDRLVYTNEDGEVTFIKIEEWTMIDDSPSDNQ